MPIKIDIERIHEVLKQWHEAGRQYFENCYIGVEYDSPPYQKQAVYKNRWVCLDEGHSGVYLLDMTGDDKGHLPGVIYRIKSKYGVPNYRKPVGNLATIDGKALASMRWR
jgi:hypothetical protein